jgi:Tfp pilus assembly protein PilO
MSGFIMILLALLATICFLAMGLSLALQSRAALRAELKQLRQQLQEKTS